MKTDPVIADMLKRKTASRAFLRSLSAEEKIRRLMILQEQYYSMLAAREANGGKPIPSDWRKWYSARHG